MTNTQAKKKKKPYLYEVDLMRVIFIFGVLANHATTAVTGPMQSDSVPYIIMLASHLILHFTRMGFMFISGLVLFLQYYHREHNSWPAFWVKRYKGSGIPYVLWTGIYTLFVAVTAKQTLNLTQWGQQVWQHLLHADSFYMYYLLVMFQLYLIFPLLVKLFKSLKTTRNHLWLMGISALVQLLFLIWAKYYFPHIDHTGWPYIFANYGNFIGSYQFYFLGGAFVSIHYQETIAFLRRHHRGIYALTALLAVGTIGLYYFNTKVLGLTKHYAELIHQPYLFVYATMMVLTVFLLSLEYAKRRTRPHWRWFASFIGLSSKISFGIYLGQTVALTLVTKWLSLQNFGNWQLLALAPLVYIVALGLTWLMSYAFYKVPPFGVLIGRPQMVIKKLRQQLRKKEVPEND